MREVEIDRWRAYSQEIFLVLCNCFRINGLTMAALNWGSEKTYKQIGDEDNNAATMRAPRLAETERPAHQSVTTDVRGGVRRAGNRLWSFLLVVLGYAGLDDLFHQAGGNWFIGGEANGAF
jgi:hypothetical protein